MCSAHVLFRTGGLTLTFVSSIRRGGVLRLTRQSFEISSLTVEARPGHALAHQAAHDASIGGHALIGDMDPVCAALIALWIDSAARPTRGAGWPDFQNKPITNLFVLMPGLTQVLTPQTDLPHGSTRIWVLPSARAQLPRYDGSLAGAALAAPIISIALISPTTLGIIQSLPTHRSSRAPSGRATKRSAR